jgi:hypothetical protein
MGFLGPSSAHHVLVGAVMDRLGPTATADVLDQAFAEPGRVGALASIYVDLGRSLGTIPTEGGTLRDRIPSDRLKALGDALLPKIEAEAEADTLSALPYYYEVARAWAHIAGTAAPREWLGREARRDGRALTKVSRGLLGTSTDHNGTRYKLYRSAETELYDIEVVAGACEAFADSPDLNDDERASIAALREGIANLKRQDEARRSREEDG